MTCLSVFVVSSLCLSRTHSHTNFQLSSFATYVTLEERATRPELSDAGPIAIKQGIHPTLVALQPDVQFMPNDTYLSPGCNFTIITGQVRRARQKMCVGSFVTHFASEYGG